jgi:hypothetical protein
MNKMVEYIKLRSILKVLQKREENCKKSPNTGFTQNFLRLRRDQTVARKLVATKLIKLLATAKKNEE